MASVEKSPDALKTIGELSQELGVAQHILRYWETKFPQLKPMQRAGNRRYYRPADVELARRIHRLLNQEGYTVRGVQKLLREKSDQGQQTARVETPSRAPEPETPQLAGGPPESPHDRQTVDVVRLIALRNRLAEALED